MRLATLALLAPLALLAAAPPQSAVPADTYLREVAAWRSQRQDRLRADDGWLTVAGLFWLEPGRARVGSGPDCQVRLPASAPAHVGDLALETGRVRYALAPGVVAGLEGRPAPARGELRSDHEGRPTVLALGPVSFYVIQRGQRLGVRVKDRESAARRDFKGLDWYPVEERWRVEALYVPYDSPRSLPVPNVLGQVEPMTSPGYVTFKVGASELRLEPVLESPDAEDFFFIFRDATTGKTTYPGGRFLYSPRPVGGRVTLDFNKAYSPPCAFTPWATCPLPPKQNRLEAAIEAGEKFAGSH